MTLFIIIVVILLGRTTERLDGFLFFTLILRLVPNVERNPTLRSTRRRRHRVRSWRRRMYRLRADTHLVSQRTCHDVATDPKRPSHLSHTVSLDKSENGVKNPVKLHVRRLVVDRHDDVIY